MSIPICSTSVPVRQLLDAINRARLTVWKRQSQEFFDERRSATWTAP
jgi:hypothetical protein